MRGGMPIDRERLVEVEDKLASLDTIEQVLDRGDRQLLVLDLSQDRAQAAIAVGDVDTADHVVPFTPGVTSTVDGSMENYDANMQDLKFNMEDILDRTGRTDETVATVSWIGYQAPQLSIDSLTDPGESTLLDGAARSGAAKLAPFLDGLDAARPGDSPHLTAIGHSYGSVVTGMALQQATSVDDAVIFGSPGPGTHDIGNLNVGEGRLVSIEAKNDVVADLGRFGGDPTFMEGVRHGSSESAVNPLTGQQMVGVEGHSAYFENDSTSQFNMAAIAVGERELVVEGRTVDSGDYIAGGVRGWLRSQGWPI
ncbi:MAG: alpha/beta hydrolase [Haloechinothrix sp.]